MNKPTLTEMETKVLAALIESAAGNGHDFGFTDDAVGVVPVRSLGGVVASLAKKGILTVHERDTGCRGTSFTAQIVWTPEYDPREGDEQAARLNDLVGGV